MVFCSNRQIFKLQLGNLLFIMHSVCRNHDFVLSCLFHLKRLSTWSWRMPGYYGPGSCQSTVFSFGADDKVSGDIFSNVKRGRFWNKIPTMNILGPLHLGVSPIWLWEAVCVWGGRAGATRREPGCSGEPGLGSLVLDQEKWILGSFLVQIFLPIVVVASTEGNMMPKWRQPGSEVLVIPQLTLTRTWSNTNSYHNKNYLEETLPLQQGTLNASSATVLLFQRFPDNFVWSDNVLEISFGSWFLFSLEGEYLPAVLMRPRSNQLGVLNSARFILLIPLVLTFFFLHFFKTIAPLYFK